MPIVTYPYTGCFSHRQLCRPVIAKLNSVLDKRIVLSGSWRLSRNDDLKVICINADEPRELQMRRTFDRLKFRVVANNKAISELNSVLYVDGSAVFTPSEWLYAQ